MDAPDASVHGVVLAAGTSDRYGDRNKLLESIDGEPLVRHAVSTMTASSVDGVTVVVGHEADRVAAVVDELDVELRHNPDYEAGQSTSIAAGIAAASERDADAVLFALGDMPRIAVETVETLVRTYDAGVADAVAAAYRGERGNPVLFDRTYFDELAAVDGDVGGRAILLDDPDAVAVETGDPGVRYDVDRPADRRRSDTE
jgi:molybdenum cofactor cytidylyltransferase